MLCHPEPFWKCCDTEPLCFSDTLVPKEPSGSQAENVSLCIQPTACQDSSVWRHLVGRVRGHLSFLFSLSPSFSSFCIFLYNHREMLHLLQNYNSSLKKNSGWSLVMWMSSGKKWTGDECFSNRNFFFWITFSWILHDSCTEAETAWLNCELDE